MDKTPEEMIERALRRYEGREKAEEYEGKEPSEKLVNLCICTFFAVLIFTAIFFLYFIYSFF